MSTVFVCVYFLISKPWFCFRGFFFGLWLIDIVSARDAIINNAPWDLLSYINNEITIVGMLSLPSRNNFFYTIIIKATSETKDFRFSLQFLQFYGKTNTFFDMHKKTQVLFNTKDFIIWIFELNLNYKNRILWTDLCRLQKNIRSGNFWKLLMASYFIFQEIFLRWSPQNFYFLHFSGTLLYRNMNFIEQNYCLFFPFRKVPKASHSGYLMNSVQNFLKTSRRNFSLTNLWPNNHDSIFRGSQKWTSMKSYSFKSISFICK